MRPPNEFGTDVATQENEEATVPPAVMICTRLAGRAIIRVVGRCEDAQENCNLGECEKYPFVFCESRFPSSAVE